MKTGLFVTSLCSLAATGFAWTNSPSNTAAAAASSRRAFLDTAAKIVPLVVAADASFADDEVAAEPVVEDAAPVVEEEAAPAPISTEETDLIAKLKARSEANKEKNLAMSRSNDKLSARQFASQYNRPSFVGVHDAVDHEKVTMYLKEDFDQMLANGTVKQTYESKVSKKGDISDDYSKPIYIFAN